MPKYFLESILKEAVRVVRKGKVKASFFRNKT
jgi:hypothetical protein